jgi:predicted dehydrogenase
MSMQPVRWGVLGVAKIAREKVIPPLKESPLVQLTAIASRDGSRVKAAAETLGFRRAYDSYQAVIDDPDVEAIYIPLPNHLHVEWAAKAVAAGKHVLCEKPLALAAAEIGPLAEAARRNNVLVMEGFMVLSHPLWQQARDLIRNGRIGPVHALHMSFASPNYDPANIRNRADAGGGSLTDKGCYAVALARYLFEDEPTRVAAVMDIADDFRVDSLTTALMAFPRAQASFNCASQLAAHQHLVVMGSKGRLEMPIPVNLPDDRPTHLTLVTGDNPADQIIEDIVQPPCNQYRLMIEQFSRAVRGDGQPSVSLAFSTGNARVIEALFRAADSGRWETVPTAG